MIRHILKDGTELKDITGHVVKIEDARAVYVLLDHVKEKKQGEKK